MGAPAGAPHKVWPAPRRGVRRRREEGSMAEDNKEGHPDEGARDVDSLSFREASVELEQIVRSLEGGSLELEDALAAYERGVALLKSLRERLASAELKVRVLTQEMEQGEVNTDTTAAPATAYVDE